MLWADAVAASSTSGHCAVDNRSEKSDWKIPITTGRAAPLRNPKGLPPPMCPLFGATPQSCSPSQGVHITATHRRRLQHPIETMRIRHNGPLTTQTYAVKRCCSRRYPTPRVGKRIFFERTNLPSKSLRRSVAKTSRCASDHVPDATIYCPVRLMSPSTRKNVTDAQQQTRNPID